jgi:four helix bundle protein
MSERKIERFEDLIAWQKARELTKQIYLLTRNEPFSRDFGLRDQIQRASVSIISNLAEGFERGSRSEFHQFIVIAKGSCAEVRSQLYVALDVGYITQEQFDHVSTLATEVSLIIGGLRSSVQKQRTKK